MTFEISSHAGKPEKNPRSKAKTDNNLNPHMAPGRNRARAAMVGALHHPCSDNVCKEEAQKGSVPLSTRLWQLLAFCQEECFSVLGFSLSLIAVLDRE